jgi:hypothetical protein
MVNGKAGQLIGWLVVIILDYVSDAIQNKTLVFFGLS